MRIHFNDPWLLKSTPAVGAEEDVVEDSVPELNEAVGVSTPAVGAEEDVVEDSAPELDEADAIGGLVVLDAPPIF